MKKIKIKKRIEYNSKIILIHYKKVRILIEIYIDNKC